jgi:hypothetical protein
MPSVASKPKGDQYQPGWSDALRPNQSATSI